MKETIFIVYNIKDYLDNLTPYFNTYSQWSSRRRVSTLSLNISGPFYSVSHVDTLTLTECRVIAQTGRMLGVVRHQVGVIFATKAGLGFLCHRQICEVIGKSNRFSALKIMNCY